MIPMLFSNREINRLEKWCISAIFILQFFNQYINNYIQKKNKTTVKLSETEKHKILWTYLATLKTEMSNNNILFLGHFQKQDLIFIQYF